MGQGGYVFCELNSVQPSYPSFQRAFAALEAKAIASCTESWYPTKTSQQAFGGLVTNAGQFGRTTIMPELFNDHSGVQMTNWRQLFTTAGHQTLITGTRTGNTIPEDFKIAWIGLAFPNKNEHITEVKWQIGDRKFGRIDLEEMLVTNKPAVVFEEGVLIEEEEAFDLYGYVEGPIPVAHDNYTGVHQRIVMLGAAYYKVVDKVLGNCGAAI